MIVIEDEDILVVRIRRAVDARVSQSKVTIVFVTRNLLVRTPNHLTAPRTYGARGDGKTLDTAAINKAIETVASRGGGTVYFGPGTGLTN